MIEWKPKKVRKVQITLAFEWINIPEDTTDEDIRQALRSLLGFDNPNDQNTHPDGLQITIHSEVNNGSK